MGTLLAIALILAAVAWFKFAKSEERFNESEKSSARRSADLQEKIEALSKTETAERQRANDLAAKLVIAQREAQHNVLNRVETTSNPPPLKDLARNQSTIKSMVVTINAEGESTGSAYDIIMTKDFSTSPNYAPGYAPQYNPSQSFQTTRFVGDVGPEMRTSLDETQRYLRLRYPQWKSSRLEISFEDKYSPHDGGSAGAAFGILLLSVFEGIDIDPKCAITGDITVDGKIRQIGGVGAKLRGAAIDKCQFAVIPEENANRLPDVMLLYGDNILWDIQIFSASTFDDAVGLVRKDRAPAIAKAIRIFEEVQADLAKTGLAGVDSKHLATKLDEILILTPNHLSARYLRACLKGERVSKFSTTATLYQTFAALHPLQDALINGTMPGRANVSKETLEVCQAKFQKVSDLSNPSTIAFITATGEFISACQAVNDATGVKAKLVGPAKDRLDSFMRTMQERRRAVLDALQVLVSDKDVRERMTRESF